MGLVITSVDQLSPRWHAQAREVVAARLGQVRAQAVVRARAARLEPTRRPSVHHRSPAARPGASWYLDAPTTSRSRPGWKL
jgi:hypothetical protein